MKGSATLLVLSILQRGIGFFGTLVLARLLTPADFGVVAIVNMVVFLFDSLSEVGANRYIIQKTAVSTDDLNTAWTVNLVLKMGFFALCAVSTPFIADYFENPDLFWLILVTLLILPLSSLKNPGLYLLHKDLDYSKIFWLNLGSKILSFVVTMGVAVMYRNYWALVIGTVVFYGAPAIGSYFIHSFRPKLSLAKFHEQWNFSQWLFFKALLGYLRAQVDTFIVSTMFTPAALGGYSLMKELANLPYSTIVRPASSPLLSSLAKVKQDGVVMARQANLAVMAIAVVVAPVCWFMFFFSTEVVSLVLGAKWIDYAVLLKIVCLSIVYIPISTMVNSFSTAKGRVRWQFFYDLLSFIAMTLVLLSNRNSPIEQIASLKVFVDAVFVVLSLLYVKTRLDAPLWSPLLSIFAVNAFAFLSAYGLQDLRIPTVLFVEVSILFAAQLVLFAVLLLAATLVLRHRVYELNYVHSNVLAPTLSRLLRRTA